MIDCPKCKATIDDDSYYCDMCGQELKICPQCATPGKGNRCTQCGTVLITAKQKAEGQTSPATVPTPPPVQTTVNQPIPGGVPSYQPPTQANVECTVRKPNQDTKTTGISLTNKVLNIHLHATDGALIGRRNGPYASQLASQAYISGTHARIDLQPTGQWTVTDLDSTNGTFYNNVQLKPDAPQVLMPGAKLVIADLELTVEAL